MDKKIGSALISVYYKEGLEPLARQLASMGTRIYSTGGTRDFLEKLGIEVVPVEDLTKFPPILGGRVKTLHPLVFGGILGSRDDKTHLGEMAEHGIPPIDLVIVDLYPFEETVASTTEEKLIIEKIDIGGPSMIRAAAKNFREVVVIADKKEYAGLLNLLQAQEGCTTLAQRRSYASRAFDVVGNYDVAISRYFRDEKTEVFLESASPSRSLRYGENPHQHSAFYGDTGKIFDQLHGKEISYNNLVDIDAALQLIAEFNQSTFAIIKHTNVCGIAQRDKLEECWKAALAGDPESAFGGVLICNKPLDRATAEAINEIFFEVVMAPSFADEALDILKTKKNRIILEYTSIPLPGEQFRSVLNGVLSQEKDQGNYTEWKEVTARPSTDEEQRDLAFANLVCKHLKSNAIAIVKDRQLVGKGCGQTSRVDALRQAIEKARQFGFNLRGAVLASDAFFPFDDCVRLGHEAGITAFIQPGGSIRDSDSIEYCSKNDLALVLTGMRHFRH